MSQLNIAAYLFVALDALPALADSVRAQCEACELKGSVLLSPEGINLFLAGAESNVERFLSWLKADPRFAALSAKCSYSEQLPFAKLQVKVKREVVPLGDNNLQVEPDAAARIDAPALKALLDSGEPVVLLDTRNAFEYVIGSFEQAVHLDIANFRSFPDAVKAQLPAWREQTVVTFCTGGIRCEKAAPLMQQLGFSKVLQLDGGILKYFELCQDAHFRGACFVFDERGALDASLRPPPALTHHPVKDKD